MLSYYPSVLNVGSFFETKYMLYTYQQSSFIPARRYAEAAGRQALKRKKIAKYCNRVNVR